MISPWLHGARNLALIPAHTRGPCRWRSRVQAVSPNVERRPAEAEQEAPSDTRLNHGSTLHRSSTHQQQGDCKPEKAGCTTGLKVRKVLLLPVLSGSQLRLTHVAFLGALPQLVPFTPTAGR